MTPSEQMFSELNWLSFPKRVKYHTWVMMFKVLNNMAPEYLRDLFKGVHETQGRSLHSVDKGLLNIPFCRTSYYSNSFTVTGAREWNALPLEQKTINHPVI